MPPPFKFNERQLKFFRKFAEALFDGFDMAIPLGKVVENFERQFELIGGKPARRIARTLDLLHLAIEPLFNGLPLAARKRLINDKLRFGKTALARDAARLKAIVYGAYYGHWEIGGQDGNASNPVHRQIGFTLPKFRNRSAAGEVKIELVDGREIDPAHVLTIDTIEDEYDVIVIGSGSGGGVAARNLAVEHGYKVLIVEAGPWMPSSAITHEERAMGAALFKDGTLQSTADDDFIIFQGRNVGGSPTINNGICLRMTQDPLGHPQARNPFDTWKADYGLDLEAAFQAAYDAVGTHLPVGVAEPRSGRGNGVHLLDGWNKYRPTNAATWVQQAKPGWFTINFGPPGTPAACAYCGYCNTGCRYARKLAPAQSYLPQACAARARVLPDTSVERIVWEDAPGKAKWHATGVLVESGPDKIQRTIRARVGVVVAAGTIASSVLLKASKVERTGKGISLNVASPMIALMHDESATPAQLAGFTPAWDEDQMTTAVDCGTFLLESHFQPPQSMAMLMPGWFGEMHRRMTLYNRMRSAGVLVPCDRRGKLDDGKLELSFSKAEMAVLRTALATLAKVHFANGAKEVWPALRTGEALIAPMSDAAIDAFFARTVVNQDDITLSSAHAHGGNPMHPDPKKGVVDADCRLHAADNVLVTDASVFPGNIRVNAHFSTMAVAQHATGGADPFL